MLTPSPGRPMPDHKWWSGGPGRCGVQEVWTGRLGCFGSTCVLRRMNSILEPCFISRISCLILVASFFLSRTGPSFVACDGLHLHNSSNLYFLLWFPQPVWLPQRGATPHVDMISAFLGEQLNLWVLDKGTSTQILFSQRGLRRHAYVWQFWLGEEISINHCSLSLLLSS